ncbi:MAG: glycosyltransferase family 39 protein [Candidatus Caenarcaniphilales bacterium]|nr:glycosyltransferase family 39 protein [Candidatus Caenarcaniphilales bacterium]
MLGTNFFALQLLHEILFVLAFVFLFLSYRLFSQSTSLGLFICTLAALANVFVSNEIIDIIVRTHTTLATTIATAFIYCFCRIVKDDSLKNYFLFGLAGALGILAKYNFVLLILLLFIAAALYKPYRKYLFNQKIYISLIIVLVLVAPNLYWLYRSREILLMNFHHKIYESAMLRVT